MRRKLASKTVKPIWLSDSAKDTSPSWDSASQFLPRILGRLSWNICHRRWSPRGRQRLLGFCYREVRTCCSARASACWSSWRRSLRLRTTHSHRVRWIRSVNPIQRYSVSSILINFDFQMFRLSCFVKLHDVLFWTCSRNWSGTVVKLCRCRSPQFIISEIIKSFYKNFNSQIRTLTNK